MTRRLHLSLVAGLVLLSLVMAFASLLVGTETLSLEQAWREWRSGLPPAQAPTLSILLQQRLPRTLAALIVGSGLALVGCAFQAMLRNPLATPYTLGVASAGALGAWTASVLTAAYGMSRSLFGISTVQVLAFLFAEADVAIVYLLAARKERLSPSVLLLGGVTMGMLANSGILLMRYLADPERLVMMDRWLMGGVDVLGYQPVKTLFWGVAPCILILLAQAPKFDQLGFGPEIAAGRGGERPPASGSHVSGGLADDIRDCVGSRAHRVCGPDRPARGAQHNRVAPPHAYAHVRCRRRRVPVLLRHRRPHVAARRDPDRHRNHVIGRPVLPLPSDAAAVHRLGNVT